MAAKVAEAATPARRATESDLRGAPRDGRKYELVDGQVVVSPAGFRHGVVALRIGARLLAFVERGQLGYVLDSSTGFRLPSGNVRSPDASFVARTRVPEGSVPQGFADLVPDLAVEVLSPEDSQRAILDKVGEYLQAGVRLVWVVDPQGGSAAVYRSLTDVRELKGGGSLDGEDVLPGFRCSLGDVLR
ncbi:MAG TPA: Uma2 family endonuclease [Vicinamibacteria bacterium]|nr:Uma2 family endonuclease [Vicinamibacteria bacterium]